MSLRDPARLQRAAADTARTFRLVWEAQPLLTGSLFVLAIIGACLPAAIAWAGRWIIEAIQRASLRPDLRREAMIAVIVELSLVILVLGVKRGESTIGSLLRALLAQDLNVRILEKAVSMDLADFESPDLYDRMTSARHGASSRPLDHVFGVLHFMQGALALLGLGALLIPLSPLAVLALLIAAIPSFVVETRFSKDAFRLFRWRTPETRKQNYLEMVLSVADFAKEVKLFQLGPLFLDRYQEIFWKLWEADRTLTLRRALWGFGLSILSASVFYAIYAWIAWEAASGRISIGEMTMYLLVFRQGQERLSSVLHSVGGLYDDQLYLRNLFAFLDRVPANSVSGTAKSGPRPNDGVRFEDVWFSYPDSDQPALRGVTFHLAPRKKLALVGENGAGKTTIIKLLTRLYRPTRGRITLDGLGLDEWDEAALRHRIGVIFQDFVEYQLLVGENIGVGDVGALGDESRWRAAAAQGAADDFIDELPEGYRTQLGRWFEDGRELSLGQWQKIALSRAFMRQNADILVLDEPTASMDAEAEARIFARFRMLTEQRTAVLISHRFSTVRMADTIAVIEHGVVGEIGSHEELMHLGGRYAHLFTLQAQGYR